MGLNKLYIRFTIPALSIIFILQMKAYSQGTDLLGKQQHLYLGFGIYQSQSTIVNTGTSAISKLSSDKKGSYNGTFEIGYIPSKFFSLSSGVGYSSYSSSQMLDAYRDSFNTTDSESETYNRRISGRNIIEIQNISFISIPLQAAFHLPFGKIFGLYLQAGANFSFPIIKEYKTSGKFNYSGFYPAYNLLITDIPYEGFASNVENKVKGELKLKSYFSEFISSGGIQINFTRKFQVSAGIFYNQLLTNISGYSPPQNFRLSTQKDQVKSMMEGSSKVSASVTGIKITFRYFII